MKNLVYFMLPSLDDEFVNCVTSACNYEGLWSIMLFMQLLDEEWCFETIEYWHADIHEDDTKTHAFTKTFLSYFKSLHTVVWTIDMILQFLQTDLVNHQLQTQNIKRLIIHDQNFTLKFTTIATKHLKFLVFLFILNLPDRWLRLVGFFVRTTTVSIVLVYWSHIIIQFILAFLDCFLRVLFTGYYLHVILTLSVCSNWLVWLLLSEYLT